MLQLTFNLGPDQPKIERLENNDARLIPYTSSRELKHARF